MPQSRHDLTRSMLAALFIGGLIAASFWVMRPFLPATIWAVTLVIATWPLMLRVQHYAGNRRGIAVFVMTVGLLLVLIVPLWLAISTIVINRDEIADLMRTILSLRVPPPPDWLAEVPLVGTGATEACGQFTSAGVPDLAPKLMPYAGSLTQWFVSAAGSLGAIFVLLLLTIAIAAVMYAGGERADATVIRFGRRLGDERGEMAVRRLVRQSAAWPSAWW
jgi:predicted PurR-regulated permease PerM